MPDAIASSSCLTVVASLRACWASAFARADHVLRAGALGLLVAGAGCAHMQEFGSPTPTVKLPPQVLSGASDAPALYLGTSATAPVVGFLGQDVLLDVLGPPVTGRVPVRVHGALSVQAYVPASLLQLRTQRRGRLRGTPVYLGPGDAVLVVGTGEKEDRLRVRAAPRMGDLNLPAFEGTYPAVGLGPRQPGDDVAEPPEGEAYMVPVYTALELHDKPNGKLEVVIPAQTDQVPARVLGEENGWFAVRVGDGPYLVGYTNARLQPVEEPAAAAGGPAGARSEAELPRRLARETGELKRVASGATVSFGGRVIAKLGKEGYARVLAVYPNGEADALVAVDDDVAVRGLLNMADLVPPPVVARTSSRQAKQ
jgi:hypothetical protein